MDSARAQSNLLLVLANVRRFIGYDLSAPVEAEMLIDYTGIDPDSPIAMAAWTPRQIPDKVRIAQRRAVVLRVKDRARFERTLERIQRSIGSVPKLTDNVAVGARAIPILPALLPLTAQVALADPSEPSGPAKSRSVLTYSNVGEREWNGLRIKTFEHGWINSEWYVEHAWSHLVYFGDTAVITSDLSTLRDLLVNATANNAQLLADNPEFRQAIENRGDAVYFSDLNAVFADFTEATEKPPVKVSERGSLKFSSFAWENSQQLVFAESEWSKSFVPFNPKELSAPRDLLPASTIAYLLTQADVPNLWSMWLKDAFKDAPAAELPNLGGLKVTEELLEELGPECGVAVLEFPNFGDLSGGHWVAFCKLKSNKLADALALAKPANGAGPGQTELKLGDESYFVSARNGFLVISNQAKALVTPDSKTNLATTRDYSRSADKVPGNIVAFGGYNLEAAIAAAEATIKPRSERDTFLANVVFSLAGAFHSQNLHATATAGTVSARSSVAMDREGRYGLADFSHLPRGTNITYAVIEAGGQRIMDHNRVSRLVLRVRAKAPGPIDNIKDDIKTSEQVVEQKSATELLLTVAARHPAVEKSLQLPIRNPELAEYLRATSEFAADKKEVIDQAKAIAGNDRDAWSVAKKLAEWTHKNLEWKYVVSADAVQTLATREADCSEFSELYIGMARSLGLPARMVSGLAYSGGSFGGHAWVEVWIGKWIELDPTWGT
ncbi:MAG TPA: transglutaminase-like domain-containing protein, partial [Pyrinomonadaceae bacterium]